jgi:hypothetical protein
MFILPCKETRRREGEKTRRQEEEKAGRQEGGKTRRQEDMMTIAYLYELLVEAPDRVT